MSNQRFTAYLSPRERNAIQAAAESMNASENYVVRCAIRAYLQLDRPPQLSQLSKVTTNGEGE